MSPRATTPKPTPKPKPAADETTEPDLPYEQAREELIEVVRKLESGGVPLAESLALWERGQKLADMCQRWLDGAVARVEAGGSVDLPTPVDPEA